MFFVILYIVVSSVFTQCLGTSLDQKIVNHSGIVETSKAHVWYKIFYTEQSKEKVPIICLHGGPGCSHHHMLILQNMAVNNPVIFYDQSGCGNSKMKDNSFTDWDFDYYVQELAMLIDTLGYEKCYLLGTSWGSTLALRYTIEYQENIQGLFLTSPMFKADDWVNDCKGLAKSISIDFYENMLKHESERTFDTVEYREIEDVFYNHFFCRMSTMPQDLIDSLNVFNFDIYQAMWGPSEMISTGNLQHTNLVPMLQQLTVPTLLMCGKYDMATPERMAEYIELIKDGQLYVFEKSAHVPFLEESKLYQDVVSNFIKTH